MNLITALSDFVFPAFCLHCDYHLKTPSELLCRPCFDLIEWEDAKRACKVCGVPKETGTLCMQCRKAPCYLQPHHSLFVSYGPAYLLFKEFERTKSSYLAKLLASFLVVGLNKNKWRMPDLIVPLMIPTFETFFQKQEVNYLIAKELAKQLGIPCVRLLKYGMDGAFYLRKKNKGENKTILLVTSQLFDGRSLKKGKNFLLSLFPKNIYSLTLFDHRTHHEV